MAAPSFVDAGTGATDAGGAWSYTCQASAAAGRVFIVHILQDGTTAAAVAVTGAGSGVIENLAGTDNAWTQISGGGTGGVFGISGAGHFLFIGRALGTGAPVISGTNSTSEDLYIRSYQFTDVSTGTTLATVIENTDPGGTDSDTAASGTIADVGVQTIGPDRLALNFVAINDDNTIPVFTGETGGDWTLAVSPYAESSGTDGAIGLQQSYVWDLGNGVATSIGAIYGGTGTNEQRAQSFASGAGGTVQTVFVLAGRNNTSSTDNLVIEIQTDSGGAPSGTVVGSSHSIPAASLSLSGSWQPAYVNATLSASTTYWLVTRRDGARDTTNLFSVYRNLAAPYADGTAALRESGSWSNESADFGFGVAYGGATINGGTATNSDATDGWGVVGFALIGTTVVDTTYYPRHPAHDHGSVTIF